MPSCISGPASLLQPLVSIEERGDKHAVCCWFPPSAVNLLSVNCIEGIHLKHSSKTKEGMVSGVNTVANRTTEQANIVGETAVTSANDLSQKTVEGVENVAASTGLVNPGDYSHGGAMDQGGDGGEGY
ncbi:synuclein, gamma b (breast cancer-specific protein 1) isoform X2 [Anguilla rostrata]|uniref:synuclein, gamma b (breast cancer-specific protein 1) isoform X2 n=1 Tax=Anguilla rostrata TaxID=7938 RepID=UPI0030D197ED